MIFKHPNAVKLMTVYLRAKGGVKAEKQLQALYYYPGNHLEAETCSWYCLPAARLDNAARAPQTGGDMFQQSKELAFHAKATDEQIELLQEQERLEVATSHNCFVDTSVSDDTQSLCLAAENHLVSVLRRISKEFSRQTSALASTGARYGRDWAVG